MYDKQRENIIKHDSELEAVNQRFENLKQHAEAKLDQANVEIAKVRTAYEKEISTYKAKLSRAEIQMQNLDRNLKVKTQENTELSQICDDLVNQIEKMGSC